MEIKVSEFIKIGVFIICTSQLKCRRSIWFNLFKCLEVSGENLSLISMLKRSVSVTWIWPIILTIVCCRGNYRNLCFYIKLCMGWRMKKVFTKVLNRKGQVCMQRVYKISSKMSNCKQLRAIISKIRFIYVRYKIY